MKHKNFFIVPNQIFELGLKPKEFAVYCCLLRHSDKNTDNCFRHAGLLQPSVIWIRRRLTLHSRD